METKGTFIRVKIKKFHSSNLKNIYFKLIEKCVLHSGLIVPRRNVRQTRILLEQYGYRFFVNE